MGVRSSKHLRSAGDVTVKPTSSLRVVGPEPVKPVAAEPFASVAMFVGGGQMHAPGLHEIEAELQDHQGRLGNLTRAIPAEADEVQLLR